MSVRINAVLYLNERYIDHYTYRDTLMRLLKNRPAKEKYTVHLMSKNGIERTFTGAEFVRKVEGLEL